MQKWIAIAIALAAACLPAVAGTEQDEKVEKTFAVGGAPAQLIVDNINGSIHVTGQPGSEIHVVAHRHLRADSAEKAAEANRDVRLDMSQDGNTVRLYVDGPFREHDGGVQIHGRLGYEVAYDFEVHVPQSAAIDLKTINGGQINVSGVEGDYQIQNINGGIEMDEAAGSGKVKTLNGNVRVLFRQNPRAASAFSSLNGEVRVTFLPDLAADLQFKTLNGGVYTDFPVTLLPRPASTGERRNGKFVYKSNEWSAARAGNGGPELTFDTLNGNIRILSRGQ